MQQMHEHRSLIHRDAALVLNRTGGAAVVDDKRTGLLSEQ
jgi:hypothetical protein